MRRAKGEEKRHKRTEERRSVLAGEAGEAVVADGAVHSTRTPFEPPSGRVEIVDKELVPSLEGKTFVEQCDKLKLARAPRRALSANKRSC